MKNSMQKKRKRTTNNENGFKVKCINNANKVYNSTWGFGALLAAISAWTAGMLYV